MSKIDDGGPAFPESVGSANNIIFPASQCGANPGMSLRAWFAGQAMKAIIGSTVLAYKTQQEEVDGAIEYADLMIAALNKNSRTASLND